VSNAPTSTNKICTANQVMNEEERLFAIVDDLNVTAIHHPPLRQIYA
jgi:hypothetical protein